MIEKPLKQFKFVLVGDSAVGKSSLLNRFVERSFNESLLSTIGVDFKFKRVRIDNNEVKLQIWDTAGQQTFRSIVSAYYTSADAILIVYDITSYDSFENVKNYWIEEAENNNKNDAKIFLIGNKIDEESRRQVERFSIDAFIEQHSIDGLYEASAKTALNVQQTFTDIARNLYFGVKPKSRLTKQKPNEQKAPNKKSIHEQLQKQKPNQPKQDQYQEVVSVDNDAKQENQSKRQKEERIKINPASAAKGKPKNPNYNKSCCLK